METEEERSLQMLCCWHEDGGIGFRTEGCVKSPRAEINGARHSPEASRSIQLSRFLGFSVERLTSDSEPPECKEIYLCQAANLMIACYIIIGELI